MVNLLYIEAEPREQVRGVLFVGLGHELLFGVPGLGVARDELSTAGTKVSYENVAVIASEFERVLVIDFLNGFAHGSSIISSRIIADFFSAADTYARMTARMISAAGV
jgi:hypothetical protein